MSSFVWGVGVFMVKSDEIVRQKIQPTMFGNRGPRRSESPNVDCFCHVSFQSDPSRRVTICVTSHVFSAIQMPVFFLKRKSAAIMQKRQTVETANCPMW